MMATIALAASKRANASIIIAGLSILITAASATAASTKTLQMIKVPSGPALFTEHCAQCHGMDGKGNGPMASSLKVAPADLTTINKRAGGKFPAERIVETIRYGGDVAAHGSREMPIWGKVFSDQGGRGKGGGAYSRRVVVELKRYLETIQH